MSLDLLNGIYAKATVRGESNSRSSPPTVKFCHGEVRWLKRRALKLEGTASAMSNTGLAIGDRIISVVLRDVGSAFQTRYKTSR